MSDELNNYVQTIEREIARYEARISSDERALSRLKQKLKNAPAALESELKRNTRRARRARGEEIKITRPQPGRAVAASVEEKTEQQKIKRPVNWFDRLGGGNDE